MVLFYTKEIQENTAHFTEDEAKHIKNSLRKSEGQTINFVDGIGNIYEGVIAEMHKKSIDVEIVSKNIVDTSHPYIHIAIAPTKNIDRIEWFLEKSIELGISEITFIRTKHSERKVVKIDRMERIAVAAMKQSLKARIPKLNDLIPYEEWVAQDFEGDSYIACLVEETKSLKKVLQADKNIRIAIGPEGGFRQSEIDQATARGFQAVSLGDQRLRTETAGLYAVAHIHLLGS